MYGKNIQPLLYEKKLIWKIDKQNSNQKPKPNQASKQTNKNWSVVEKPGLLGMKFLLVWKDPQTTLSVWISLMKHWPVNDLFLGAERMLPYHYLESELVLCGRNTVQKVHSKYVLSKLINTVYVPFLKENKVTSAPVGEMLNDLSITRSNLFSLVLSFKKVNISV